MFVHEEEIGSSAVSSFILKNHTLQSQTHGASAVGCDGETIFHGRLRLLRVYLIRRINMRHLASGPGRRTSITGDYRHTVAFDVDHNLPH